MSDKEVEVKDTEEKKTKKKVKKQRKLWQKILRVVLIIIGILVLITGGFLAWLTVNEYRPKAVEKVKIDTSQGEGKKLKMGEDIKIFSWNFGFGQLGDNADFIMDGGKEVMPSSEDRVKVNIAGFQGSAATLNPDIFFVQEIDRDSKRAYHIDEYNQIKEQYPILTSTANQDDPDFNGYVSTFAYNMKTKFLPYPVSDPMGRIYTGIATYSKYQITDSERISLPVSYDWPVRTFNFKRCLLVNRTPVYDKDGNDTGKEFVFVNLHLEGYDDNNGRVRQCKKMIEFINEEYNKGNYVVAGGDFNQTFSNTDASMYPYHDEIKDLWKPGKLNVNDVGNNFTCYMDNTVPTCRSLDKVYQDSDKENFQYYMLDGFIVSNNIKVEEMHTYNANFAPCDHNPVMITLKIEE